MEKKETSMNSSDNDRKREYKLRYTQRMQEAAKQHYASKGNENRRLSFIEPMIQSTNFGKVRLVRESGISYNTINRLIIMDDGRLTDIKKIIETMGFSLSMELTSGNEEEDIKAVQTAAKFIELKRLSENELASGEKIYNRLFEISSSRGNLASIADWIIYKGIRINRLCSLSEIPYSIITGDIMKDNIKVSRAYKIAEALDLKVRWRIKKNGETGSEDILF